MTYHVIHPRVIIGVREHHQPFLASAPSCQLHYQGLRLFDELDRTFRVISRGSSAMSKTCSSAISAPSSLSHSAPSNFGKPETASVAQDINTRVQHLLADFAQRGITVTEWGTILYCRYNVPHHFCKSHYTLSFTEWQSLTLSNNITGL